MLLIMKFVAKSQNQKRMISIPPPSQMSLVRNDTTNILTQPQHHPSRNKKIHRSVPPMMWFILTACLSVFLTTVVLQKDARRSIKYSNKDKILRSGLPRIKQRTAWQKRYTPRTPFVVPPNKTITYKCNHTIIDETNATHIGSNFRDSKIDSSIFQFDYLQHSCPPQFVPYPNANEMHPSLIWLYRNLTEILDEHNISHSLAAGMLLALERSNYTKVFLPWDDDFDMVVDISSLQNLTELLEGHPILDNTRPKTNTKDFGSYLKLAYKDRNTQSGVSNSSLSKLGTEDYPAIDVFIRTNWKDKNMGNLHFPTRRTMVGNLSISIPNCTRVILDKRYGGSGPTGWKSNCVSLKWNHGGGYDQKSVSKRCDEVFTKCGYCYDFHSIPITPITQTPASKKRLMTVRT